MNGILKMNVITDMTYISLSMIYKNIIKSFGIMFYLSLIIGLLFVL